MIILGIDQSLVSTGYAVLDYKGESNYSYNTWGRIKTKKEALVRTEERINKISSELVKIAMKYEPDWIIMERPIIRRGMKTGQDLAGLYYVIACKLIAIGFSVISVVNTSWKRNIGINSKASKEQKEEGKQKAKEILKRVAIKGRGRDVEFKSDDESDAICMAWYLAKEVEKNG